MQRLVLCSFFVALSFPVWAATQTSSVETVLDRIETYLDRSTIFVGHFDLKKVDPDKSVATLREIVDGALKNSEMDQEMRVMIQPMIGGGMDALEKEWKEGDQWQQLQNSGCGEIYVVINSMTMAQSPARMLFVLDSALETAQIDSLQEKLEAESPNIRFQRKDGLLVADIFQPGAEIKDVEKVVDAFDKSRRPLIRPEFLAGMERTKTAPFKLIFAPDVALKGMIQMFYPMAPPEVQQALPAATILDGAHWISLGIDINRWIIDLNIKGENAQATKTLYDAIIKLKDNVLAQVMVDFPDQAKAMDDQIMPFIPKIQGDRLRLTINQKFLDDNLPKIIQYALPAIMAAQEGMQFIPLP